jgi:uncharacterized membrane protein
VNDGGVVVGTLQGANDSQIPVRWTAGVPGALPLPDSAIGGVASAINARGQITGYVVSPSIYEPVLWEGDEVTPLAGAWGAMYGFEYGINDRGEVTLSAFTFGNFEFGGRVWRDGTFRRLDPAYAVYDINDRGVAVGFIFAPDDSGDLRGAIWPKANTRLPVHSDPR